ncbi:MAG: hypothetical protein FWG07_03715 [Treponema sp.]|nr:hypothetical protein [Treponema sp.]
MEFFRVFLKNPINEKLFCYILNPEEAISIDPHPENYFSGNVEDATVLKVSEYYVTQVKKGNLENIDLIDIAIELQKEALWNRCKLECKLYLRKLFEDNSPVTQLWRPIIKTDCL